MGGNRFEMGNNTRSFRVMREASEFSGFCIEKIVEDSQGMFPTILSRNPAALRAKK